MPGDASTLLTLPLEILSEIFSHLTRREAVGAKGTCRVLRDVCRSLESEEPGRKLHHRLRLMVACSSTAEVVEFSLRGQDPPKRVAVGRAWAKSDKVKRFRRKDGPWLTGIALSPDGDRLYCQCYHELGTVVLDGKTLEYKRMYLPPQKEWKFHAEHITDYTPLMENDWQIQGPEGIACAGDKVYTTFADGKVGCIYLNKEKAREPMYLAARCIDRFVHNLGSLWIEGTDPIYAFCQTEKARDCSEIYVRLGDEYEEEWRPNAPIPRWKLEGPCCFHVHATGAACYTAFDPPLKRPRCGGGALTQSPHRCWCNAEANKDGDMVRVCSLPHPTTQEPSIQQIVLQPLPCMGAACRHCLADDTCDSSTTRRCVIHIKRKRAKQGS